MVRSKLDPTINYPEIKTIDNVDINYDAPIYEANVLGIATVICIGQPNYTFAQSNQVVFYPIYLMKNEKVVSQIGIYEVLENNIPTLLDNDDDLDLSKLNAPLLYSFTNEKLIRTAIRLPSLEESKAKKESERLQKESEKIRKEEEAAKVTQKEGEEGEQGEQGEGEETESEEEESESEEDTEEVKKSVQQQLIQKTKKVKDIYIPLQTLEQALSEIKAYKEIKGQPWIQTYYQNNNFNIVNIQPDGDCLYNTIKTALESVGINTSVIELRKQVSNRVSRKQFETYLERYNMFNDALKTAASSIKKLVADNTSIREKFNKSLSREEKVALKAQSDENIKLHNELKAQIEATKSFMIDVEFMKGVKNIEMLKDVMNTHLYYADEWAISTLEQVLNIKLIIISRDQYEEAERKPFEKSNIITCGIAHKLENIEGEKLLTQGQGQGQSSRPSEIEEEITDFNPDYYILADHGGVHYNLITYRDAKIFTFGEIPYYVKLQIVNRCLERMSGVYQHIPQFRKFNEELGLQKGGSKTSNELDEEIVDIVGMESLYNPKTVFMIHDQAMSRPFPGEAMGEVIAKNGKYSDHTMYLPLASNKNWRKKLSNQWQQPFMLDNHRWISVEHYYNANKFKKYNPDFYLLFTMDSHKKSKYYDESNLYSKICENPELAKIAGSKTGKGKYNGKNVTLRPDNVNIDPDFFNGRNSKVLEDALNAKFSQNDNLAEVLLLTRNAKLTYYNNGKTPKTFKELMKIRAKIRSEN